jgi:hypothetical protein
VAAQLVGCRVELSSTELVCLLVSVEYSFLEISTTIYMVSEQSVSSANCNHCSSFLQTNKTCKI